MTDTTTAIAAAPLFDVFAPYLVAGLSALFTGLVGLAVAALRRWTGIQISAAYLDTIKAAAATEAAKAVAAADASIATAQIHVGSPIVAQAVNAILGANDKHLKDALDATGVSPGLIASFVAAGIGSLQSRLVTVTVPASPAEAAKP